MYQQHVILSGVFLDEGEKNGVEGSPDITPYGKLREILRLRNPTLRTSLTMLGVSDCSAQNDMKKTFN
jgi:hypothetical protein